MPLLKEMSTELLFTSLNYTDIFFITKLIALGKLSARLLPRHVKRSEDPQNSDILSNNRI